jgi:hypothetical protein
MMGRRDVAWLVSVRPATHPPLRTRDRARDLRPYCRPRYQSGGSRKVFRKVLNAS